jgi:cytochrome c oxidase accessory protein FixG
MAAAESKVFDPELYDESFRDSVGTIGKDGSRNWLYPHKPKGPFYTKRSIASIVYLVLFFTIPFIKIGGEPIMLLNILERKFIILGFKFYPQDMFLFAIAMLTFMVFIVLFTAIFGRLFCGWACPQTIFMEMVFRRIEYAIEGDAPAQKLLNKGPWNTNKIKKKALKYSIFLAISFIIANFFLAYIISMDELIKIITDPISAHIGGFIAISIFTGVFFLVYSWFREQACLVVCPYGRLQGVLLDKQSIVVAYDYVRGEPREKFHKNEVRAAGDCIDCFQCVKVCPTGIDIRNGTQLECVNCTACIDACDNIMEKVNKPKGLIRYTSEEGIRSGEKLKLSPRIIGYSIVLMALITGLGFGLSTRGTLDSSILRAPGTMFQTVGEDSISNLYHIKSVNKTSKAVDVSINMESQPGKIRFVGNGNLLHIEADGMQEGVFFVTMARKDLDGRKNDIDFQLKVENKTIEKIRTNFLGPSK